MLSRKTLLVSIGLCAAVAIAAGQAAKPAAKKCVGIAAVVIPGTNPNTGAQTGRVVVYRAFDDGSIERAADPHPPRDMAWEPYP
jgi:hypothetical protein